MKVLVLGATGATGRLLVKELLKRGCEVKAVTRSGQIPGITPEDSVKLTIHRASVPDLSSKEWDELTADCDAAASCLGHNITFKGLFGHPRRLVTDAVRSCCISMEKTCSGKSPRFVHMNTVGNRNKDLKERRSIPHHLVLGLMRLALPPVRDNEESAEYLRVNYPEGKSVEWSAVRPDSLIDEDTVSAYTLHPSPLSDPLFNPGKTSRINVAHFMAELLTGDAVWLEWKGRMPVIYNS